MGGDTQVHYSSVQQLQPADAPKSPWWSSSVASRVVALTISLAVIGFSLDFLQRQTDVQELRAYSVAINSVSGLDPDTDLLRRPVVALDPEFNLTVRVASSGIWATECAEPGMYVEVSYRDVALASSVAMAAERVCCAGPKKMAETAVVARSAGVVVPGSVLGSLAMQMRSGAQVFDVVLRGGRIDTSCGLIRVGDAKFLRRVC